MVEKCPRGVITTFVILIAILTLLSGTARSNANIALSIFFNGSSIFKSQSNERKIFDLINEERMKYRAGALVWDARLGNVARAYSNKMATGNFFGHKDLSGNGLVDRLNDFDITGWTGVGENLYYCQGFDDPTTAAVNGWLKSSGHRTNLLNRTWKSTGIGIGKTSDGRVYVTQVFMR